MWPIWNLHELSFKERQMEEGRLVQPHLPSSVEGLRASR